MIVEFTGIPCSGKSTIYSLVKESIDNRSLKNIYDAKEYVLQKMFLRIPQNKAINIILTDLTSLYIFLSLDRDQKRYAFKMLPKIFTLQTGIFNKLNLIRNVIKKIAVYFYILRAAEKRVYIFDEGLIHCFQNVLVGDSLGVNAMNLQDLLSGIPLPDIIIAISVEHDIALERISKRGHRRIEITSEDSKKNFLNNAQTVIDNISNDKLFSGRIWKYSNNTEEDLLYSASDITKRIESLC